MPLSFLMTEQTTTRPDSSRRRRRRRKPKSPKKKSISAAQVLEQTSQIDQQEPVEAQLSALEIAELKEHFQFLAKHRKILKLKTNSQEDLLLSGAREPERRGVCLHLLKKVDRQSVNSALTRLQDPKLKTNFLGGLVRFYPDIQTVLAYLESLKDSVSKDEAAAALSVGLGRLDFTQVSPAQMRRVLDLCVSVFNRSVLPQVMLGLLGSDSFRKALDGSLDQLPSELKSIFEPLRVVYPVVWKGHRRGINIELLEQGLTLILEMPDANVRKYPERIRERLVEACLLLPKTEGRIERGVNILLETFAKSSRVYSGLAMKRAAALLRNEQEAKAKKVLSQLTTNQVDFQMPRRWLEAMEKPRVGRTALVELEPDKLEGLSAGVWLRGFSFEYQESVWVEVADEASAGAFDAATELHQKLMMPQLLPLVDAGVSAQKRGYRVLPALGKPAAKNLKRGKLRGVEMLRLVREGIALIAGVLGQGVTLQRLMLQDCHVDAQGRLWLARLSQAVDGAKPEAAWSASLDWLGMCLKMSRDKAMAQRIRAAAEQSRDVGQLLVRLSVL